MDRDVLLNELGLGPVWKLRSYRGALLKGESSRASGPAAAKAVVDSVAMPPSVDVAGASKVSDTVELADAAVRPALAEAVHNSQENADAAAPADMWATLEAEIRACRACPLCKQRKQAVPGVGDRQADWLFVGEGPGADEDEQGEPFVGQAGKLLDAMLAAIGLKRGEGVYIANAVKCRPPENRTPEAAEMAACKPFLDRQIALLKPRLIVLLGRAAAHSVLGTEQALSGLRGKRHTLGDIPVVVTYHPAYLLRTLHDKAKAWDDLCLARRLMRESAPR